LNTQFSQGNVATDLNDVVRFILTYWISECCSEKNS